MAHKNWFSKRQSEFLETVSQDPFFAKFYLTGGTALAAVYYNHRYSEDLDFFSHEEFSPIELQNFLRKIKTSLDNPKIRRNMEGGINSFLLVWPDGEELKLDFIYYAFTRLQKGTKVYGVEIDSIVDICANKLETMLSRTAARDYIDLYTIIKKQKLNMEDVWENHFKKYEMELSQLEKINVLRKASEAKDLPRMKGKLDYKEVIVFFEKQAKALTDKVMA